MPEAQRGSTQSVMETPAVGQRRSYDGALCTVRYVGEVAGASAGTWLGIEWDDAGRGKHDGVHKGVRYFACRSGPSARTPASFVRPSRPAGRRRTFLEAVRDKYASDQPLEDDTAAAAAAAPVTMVIISGKVAEEVGFDKVRRQLAQLETLRVVILDGMGVVRAGDDLPAIGTTCPRIAELDLSRNLFTDFETVEAICGQLPELRSLRLNGNRFQVDDTPRPFPGLLELALDETLLTWDEIGRVAARFPRLTQLSASGNQLASLPALPALFPQTLTSLSLEFNDFAALSDLVSLAALPALRNLHLKSNSIAHVAAPTFTEKPPPTPVFPVGLRYVDLAYNRIASWAFVDALPDVFPGLASLRLTHNPVYGNLSDSTANNNASTEEAYMITVGRLAALRTLNFSAISDTDRANAEMFYLSRIAKQMAAVPPGAPEAAVVARHRRYAELCALYGEPTIVRHIGVNPAFLEARLVQVTFCRDDDDSWHKTVEIPKSLDMYAVKGLVGRLLGASPQSLRLVWETGEWDPVVGLDDDDDDDNGDDLEDRERIDEAAERAAEKTADAADYHRPSQPAGRWVKREVELKDSPRQLGFCVDGLEARIRVQKR